MIIFLKKFIAGLLPAGIFLVAGVALGQAVNDPAFPRKPIRLVTAEPGGGVDVVARIIAQGLTTNLGQTIVVENRGAANGTIAAQIVMKAPADGYTLLMFSGPFWLAPLLRDGVPYDPVRDFEAVSLAAGSPNILTVHPAVTAESVKDLIALARAKPGVLNYAGSGSGSSPHLAAELFKAMAGVSLTYVPYKGAGIALTDLIAGQVQVMFATATSATTHVRSGRLKALAVTSAQPSALFPELLTVAATLPGFETGSLYGLFAPAKTPAAIVNRINSEVLRVLGNTDVKVRLLSAGAEVIGGPPERLGRAVKSEMSRLGKVIKSAGIRGD